MAKKRIKISVPASSANLGPGFDGLGIALNLLNDFTVCSADGKSTLRGTGTCAGMSASGNIFLKSFRNVCASLRRDAPAVDVVAHGRVPLARGLGSSATAIVAGAIAANYFLGEPYATEELLGLCTAVEGHPDNVAPALLGSLAASVVTPSGVLTHLYRPATDWRFVLLIPGYEVSTSKARAAIPAEVPHKAAVFNLTRIPFIIDAIVEGDGEELCRVMDDRLHEPYRKKLIRNYAGLRKAALKAGSSGVYLSGAGPTLAAPCLGDATAHRVRDAMLSACKNISGETVALVLKPRRVGATIKELD